MDYTGNQCSKITGVICTLITGHSLVIMFCYHLLLKLKKALERKREQLCEYLVKDEN